jgi:hypothetical protein
VELVSHYLALVVRAIGKGQSAQSIHFVILH